MAIRTELTLRLPNSPGALAGVCHILAEERVNIAALALEAGGTLRMLVDNHVHAAGALRDRHFQVNEHDVVHSVVPHDPGGLSRVLRLMADAGVNVEYAYATAVDGQPMAAVVVGVADALEASSAAGL